MAVEAQYNNNNPYNIHILNRNDVQQGKSPLGGGFLLDHHTKNTMMPLHHHTVMENNSRKRGREPSSPLVSILRPNNFVDLNQLHHHHHQNTTPQNKISTTKFVSTGLGLAFGDQQQQNQSISPQSSSAHSSVMISLLSDQLGSHIKHQRQEIESFLLAQGEELRRTLAEKKQRHYRTLLTAAEESLSRRLKEKEAEVEKAARRNVELEAKAAQLSLEAQAWQTRAMMQENYAATLQLQLQQGIISGSGKVVVDGGDEWGEGGNSTAVIGGGGDADDAESAFIDPDRVLITSHQPSCKACRNRVASVVLLPCRHMCLCTECDAVAQACPICLSLRCSSINVLFS